MKLDPELHAIQLAKEGPKRRFAFAATGLFGALLVIIAALLGSAPISHAFAACGLILDIAGVMLLTTGLMLPDWLVADMGIARWGQSPAVSAYWAQARDDARAAAGLLVVGFALQTVALIF
ncbi:MAG: hypothetical protein E6H91_01750 [Chloroflexi bacterium]|nr:MAG: hypothetical protein E6H91_01750 [Chloroflexota bacterium]